MFKSSKITVTFIDQASGEVLGVTKLPAGELPESFDEDTLLHIGDDEWSVVEARPATRAEYERTRSLALKLSRIERVDPRTILFSLPSICDSLPPLEQEPLTEDDLRLLEDDWRQLELVDRRHAAEADTEIEAIRRIHAEARAEPGWSSLHVRRGLEAPIPGTFAVAEVLRRLGLEGAAGSVGYHGADGRIASGFAIEAPGGLVLYGLAPGGRVAVLGIAQGAAGPDAERTVASLRTLARDFELDLIHWCRCLRASWDDAAFDELLTEPA
jgi:hypothetical protein